MSKRTAEEMAALKVEVEKFVKENPEESRENIATKFGLKRPYLDMLYKKWGWTGGGKRKSKKNDEAESKPAKQASSNGELTLSFLAEKAREFADLCDRVAENYRKKAEELFL